LNTDELKLRLNEYFEYIKHLSNCFTAKSLDFFEYFFNLSSSDNKIFKVFSILSMEKSTRNQTSQTISLHHQILVETTTHHAASHSNKELGELSEFDG
jgi:hypothetical protein